MSYFLHFCSAKTFAPENQAAPDLYLPLLSLSLSLSTLRIFGPVLAGSLNFEKDSESKNRLYYSSFRNLKQLVVFMKDPAVLWPVL
jgi:hypothetical protein